MKKLFTFAAAVLASISLWAQEPTVALTAKTSAIADWNATYGNVTLKVQGAGLADKKPCGVSTNEKALSLSSADSHWLEISCPDGLSKVVIRGSGNSSGTTDYAAPLCVCTSAPFDSIITGIIEVHYTGYDQDCEDSEITLPAGTKSVRLYRRMKVNAEGTAVGSGSNWAPASATGNQTFNISYVEVYAGSATPSTDSVAAATVTGANECYVGQSVTLTCTAAHATTYQWYNIDGEIAGATAKTYVFEAAAVGSYGFYCMASNQYNVEPVRSNSFVVEVSPIPAQCGLLVSATTNGAVGGVATGSTIDTSLGTGNTKKLNKKNYFGIKLGIGTFQAGDTFAINITEGADLGKFMLYADKTGSELVFDEGITYTKSDATEPVICPTGLKKIVLPAAANGKSALYLYRENGNTQWNVTFDSIAITRSCEASSDATISRVYVVVGEEEHVFTQDADTFYFNIPYEVGGMTSIPVNYVLSHPAATATPASPLVINIPEPGQKVEQVVTVTAEDGTTTKAYTIRGIRNASLSNDATLKSLSVTGYTLVPAFASDVYEYTITKAYGAQNPGSDLAVYEAAQGAHGVRSSSADGDTIYITVTAEDNVTSLVYSIAIAEGEAKKDLLEAVFSNGVHGFIANGNINVPYLQGEAQPTFSAAKFWNADGNPTAAIQGGKLVVTGADSKTAEYTITYIPVAPMVASYDTITFDTVPNYVYSVYGWDADKGVKFSKDAEETTNHRISEGKDRIYIALPAAKEVHLISGTGAERPVYILVNNDTCAVKKTAKKGESITIPLSASHANFIAIESKGNSGDAGFVKMLLVEAGDTPEPTYHVTCDGDTENGAVGIEGGLLNFKAGVEITLTNIPDPGYELDEYIVYKTGEPTTLVTVTDGKFIMPAYDVTVSATFKLIPVVEMFTVTLGSYEHGNVAFIEPNEGNKYEAGAEVRLSVTPDEGYELEAISLEGIDLAIPVVDGVASFNMPAQNVTVLATFILSSGQGFDNIDASMKATKRIINGKLFIEKNGKLYDAQGAMVK